MYMVKSVNKRGGGADSKICYAASVHWGWHG